MTYCALPLECYCGEVPEQILEVGFTSDRNLVIHYWCAACNRVIFASRTLDECRDLCPAPDCEPAVVAAEDARFLESLGISSGQ
jgi:hypothetical protein